MLYDVVNTLRTPAELPIKNKNHNLKGKYNNKQECHIAPNWLLIYRIKDDELVLDRTGTHSDLFDE